MASAAAATWTRGDEAVPGAVDDATLVAGVVAGDGVAFERLYDRHKTTLYRTALAVTREPGAAEELLQEAFLRAYRHAAQVKLTPGASLRPWLHRVLINLAYDWSARQRRVAAPLDAVAERFLVSPTVAPEQQAELRDLEQMLAEAVQDLPFKHRIVVILFYVHDMDMQAIGDVLDLPAGTVKSRLFYARGRLRQRLTSDARLTGALETCHAPS